MNRNPKKTLSATGREDTQSPINRPGPLLYSAEETGCRELSRQSYEEIPNLSESQGNIEALRDSEARFRAIFENAAVGIARLAPDGRWLEVNQRLCDIVGYDRKDLMAKTFADITHPDDLEQDVRQMQRVLTGEIDNYVMEKRYYRKDGSVVWVNLTVALRRKADGSPDYFISVIEDISARKLAEESMRESKEQLAGIVSSAMDAIITVDDDQRIVLFNEAAERMFGCPAAEAMGQLLDRFIPDRFRDTHAEHVRRCGETGGASLAKGRPSALVALRSDGTEFPIEASISSIEVGGRRLYTVIYRDITERKRAEAEREQLAREQVARAAAEAANRSKDEFLAIVSHELRTPLIPILGYTQMLRSRPADRDFINNVAAVVERNAKAQLQIIEDLFDSARIITGNLRIETRPVDLAPVLEAALDTVRSAAEAKGITLVTDFAPPPEQVLGDSTRLQQVVWNLLTNAVKFTPQGGRVELRIESAADSVRITVSDTGMGIEQKFLPVIFDPFRQADPSSTRRHGGLGLGLSLVKHLVELHGGTITAASEGLGLGATFTVTLPRRQLEFIEPPTPAVAPREVRTGASILTDQELSLEGVSVLVVDDQEEARELLIQALSEYGARVTAVSSGAEALAFLSNPPEGKRPDALILDIAMPDEDGYAVLKKVRALEAAQGAATDLIPAIALTAYGRGEDRVRALRAGFHTHVAKPVEPTELAVVITGLTTRRAWERKREESTTPSKR
jgi:PAS domain S-box-containing protein